MYAIKYAHVRTGTWSGSPRWWRGQVGPRRLRNDEYARKHRICKIIYVLSAITITKLSANRCPCTSNLMRLRYGSTQSASATEYANALNALPCVSTSAPSMSLTLMVMAEEPAHTSRPHTIARVSANDSYLSACKLLLPNTRCTQALFSAANKQIFSQLLTTASSCIWHCSSHLQRTACCTSCCSAAVLLNASCMN
jgi:hypothetical protein